MKYTIEYFIDKFTRIPDDMIKVSTESNSYDAWEWCTPGEAKDLGEIIKNYETTLLEVNDGIGEWVSVSNKTPKERILMFFKIIKEVKDELREVM